MPREPLTDDEIRAVARDREAIARFTSSELRRLRALDPDALSAWMDAEVKTETAQKQADVRAHLPTVTGAIGGIVGGVPGAALGGATGRAAQLGLDAWEGTGKPPSLTEAVKDVVVRGGLEGGAEAVGVGLGALATRGAGRFMQSALKPSAALAKEYRTTAPALVRTLLDEGVSVTPSGVAKLQRLLDMTDDRIGQAVANAAGTIEKPIVASRALETAGRFANQTNPSADLRAIGDVVEEFLNHPTRPGALTIPEAQAMKIGTYREIGKKYGELSAASVEAQKALARGLKEEIAAAVPEISALNLREGALRGALDATGSRVAQAGNRDPVGFAWVTQKPMTFLAAMIDRSPAVKSYLARGLWDQAAAAARVSADSLRAAVAALMQETEPEAGP